MSTTLMKHGTQKVRRTPGEGAQHACTGAARCLCEHGAAKKNERRADEVWHTKGEKDTMRGAPTCLHRSSTVLL
eukprot:1142382-Pelagomonas_calceolata.AAC.13